MNRNEMMKMNEGYYTQQIKDKNPYKLVYFEAKVLNDFIYDPRYQINNFIFKCNISIKEKFDNTDDFDDNNKIILDNIGFGYNEKNVRIISVFLKNLSELPYKMQNRFYTYEINNNTFLDPGFIKSINGRWNDEISIINAIHYEMKQINEICEGDENFFKEIYSDNNLKEFNILLLPTKNEYNSFISTFDKLLSDNINKKYFKEKSESYREKNTIRLLKEWLEKIDVDSEIINKIINPIVNVRNQRNKPSHSISDDEYNIDFYNEQTNILKSVYCSLKCLINVLIKYYKKENFNLEEWFINNNILSHSLEEIKNQNNKNYQMIQ